jgi:hypothetical protein
VKSNLTQSITLGEAKSLIKGLAHDQSLLLLSPPGLGKSATVAQAAAEAGLPCRSLLGTQIAPEDVSGIPKIIHERSVFCPPRILLPESPTPFCLFLDELPACAPDVQKAFYSLLLERRLGEHALPQGTWVVAAGNRAEDRAMVRPLSSALVNRVFVLHVRVDVDEWLAWALASGVRSEVREFMAEHPESLLRPVPAQPVPFSTPRGWACLSRSLNWAQASCLPAHDARRVLAAGLLSPQDAAEFCSWIGRGCPRPDPQHNLASHAHTSLAELELSVRATNYLESEGITTVGELVLRTAEEILDVVRSKQSVLDEITAKLAELDLHLGMGA